MKKLSILLVCFFSLTAQSQTLDRWAALVNWDGTSHWSKYIIYSPSYMGPNALPVPAIGNGNIDSINWVKTTGAFHFCKGDQTQNIELSGNYCLVRNFISMDLSWIPKEWYRMSPELKDIRHVYYKSYNAKRARGDMYLNTNIQILNKWRKNVQLLLRIGYRFPTSSRVGAARYTDAPGYHIALSGARSLSKNSNWKLLAMLGFYSWQMNTYGQDDAFLFGTGIEYTTPKWRWQLHTSGYLGWADNGDDMLVTGTTLERNLKNFSFSLDLKQGLHDYNYSSIGVGVKYKLATTRKILKQ